MNPKIKKIYFATQGVAVLVWWAVLFFSPEIQQYFLIPGADSLTLTAYLPADALLIGFGSLYCAARWPQVAAVRIAWLMAGAIWYLTSYLFILCALGDLPIHGPFGMTMISLAMMFMLHPDSMEERR